MATIWNENRTEFEDIGMIGWLCIKKNWIVISISNSNIGSTAGGISNANNKSNCKISLSNSKSKPQKNKNEGERSNSLIDSENGGMKSRRLDNLLSFQSNISSNTLSKSRFNNSMGFKVVLVEQQLLY
ncbi:hypothetical protein ACTFIU_009900 [Dictyostelium citrinum]